MLSIERNQRKKVEEDMCCNPFTRSLTTNQFSYTNSAPVNGKPK